MVGLQPSISFHARHSIPPNSAVFLSLFFNAFSKTKGVSRDYDSRHMLYLNESGIRIHYFRLPQPHERDEAHKNRIFFPFVIFRPQNCSSSLRSPTSLSPFSTIAGGISRTEARRRCCLSDAERVVIFCIKIVQIHVRNTSPSAPSPI